MLKIREMQLKKLTTNFYGTRFCVFATETIPVGVHFYSGDTEKMLEHF